MKLESARRHTGVGRWSVETRFGLRHFRAKTDMIRTGGLSNFGLLRRTEIAAVEGTEATLCWRPVLALIRLL